MKLPHRCLFLPLMALLGACSDDAVPDADSPKTIGLHLFGGWTAEVPISSEVRSIAFENWRGAEWERIYTVEVKPGQSAIPLPVYIVPGVDLEREAIYAIVGFRGAYKIPDGMKGKLVWKGVERISEGCFQILSLDTDEGLVPCVRVKTMTSSEQAAPSNGDKPSN